MTDIQDKLGIVELGEELQYLPRQLLFPLDEGSYGLPKVLGNIFGFVVRALLLETLSEGDLGSLAQLTEDWAALFLFFRQLLFGFA